MPKLQRFCWSSPFGLYPGYSNLSNDEISPKLEILRSWSPSIQPTKSAYSLHQLASLHKNHRKKLLTRFYSFMFYGNGCSERSCFKHFPPNFPQNLRPRCSRQSSEEGSPLQVPLFFAWANCPQSTLGQSASVLGVRPAAKEAGCGMKGHSFWPWLYLQTWGPKMFIAVKVVVTIILLLVLMASHLIYSNAFGKSFKVSQYLHSNATCHQMSA